MTITYNRHGVISFRQDAEFSPVAAGYYKYNGGAYSLTTGNRIPVDRTLAKCWPNFAAINRKKITAAEALAAVEIAAKVLTGR